MPQRFLLVVLLIMLCFLRSVSGVIDRFVHVLPELPDKERAGVLTRLEESAFTEIIGTTKRPNELVYEPTGVRTKAGNYSDLSEYFFSLLQTRDLLYAAKSNALIAEIEAKSEFDKMSSGAGGLQPENRIQGFMLNETIVVTFGLACFSIMIIIIVLLLIQRKRLRTRYRNIELEQKLFKTQINPHFMFNALNAIQSFIYKNEPGEAGKYLSYFAKFIRLVLTNSREEFITLNNEIRTLELYLQLQRLRFNDKFDYNIEIDPSINCDLVIVPPMLAQPFLENSLEHGVQHLSTQGCIRILYRLSSNRLVYNIEDIGVGITHGQVVTSPDFKKHESMAKTITEERLKLLNKSKQQKIFVVIKEVASDNEHSKGTLISFNIPFQTLNDKNRINRTINTFQP